MTKHDALAEQAKKQNRKPERRNLFYWFAVGFGSGLAPKAPGTAGTLIAVPLYLLLSQLVMWQYLAVVLVLLVAGIWICDTTAKQMGVHDDPSIVWDEIVGYLITMIASPPGWFWIVAGFVLFRLFDILKPWPIRYIDQKVQGGFGIMLDDVLAAIFALVVLQVGQKMLPL
jgi:phosphatidylglycerophosphatase A